MTREIKLKAWHVELKKFVLIGVDPNDLMNPKLGDYRHDELIWVQYTGLKDKNGKEIYEGDIVKTARGICVVEWKGGAFGYSNVMWNLKDEVIGNIYENPELLEEGGV